MSIEAMKQALEALDGLSEPYDVLKAQNALRTAIEQADKQVEPFGHFQYDIKLDAWVKSKTNNGVAFYTTPPAAQSQDIKSGIETVAAQGGLLPQQEPVGWFAYDQKMRLWFETNQGEDDSVPLYTTPPAAQSQDIKSGIETVAAQGGLLPQQEPVGWFAYDQKMRLWFETNQGEDDSVPLYTTPPAAQREWVGLTEIEICDIEAEELTSASSESFSFARAIEAKLKEKNT